MISREKAIELLSKSGSTWYEGDQPRLVYEGDLLDAFCAFGTALIVDITNHFENKGGQKAMSPCADCNKSKRCQFKEQIEQQAVEAYNNDEPMPECDFYFPRRMKHADSSTTGASTRADSN